MYCKTAPSASSFTRTCCGINMMYRKSAICLREINTNGHYTPGEHVLITVGKKVYKHTVTLKERKNSKFLYTYVHITYCVFEIKYQ